MYAENLEYVGQEGTNEAHVDRADQTPVLMGVMRGTIKHQGPQTLVMDALDQPVAILSRLVSETLLAVATHNARQNYLDSIK